MIEEQTLCLLFTDLVESTALASRVGDEIAQALWVEHVTLLREAIAATGGREVKSLGDGVMVTFGSSVAATRCAIAMQQAIEQRNRRAEHRLELRIGVSLGDVSSHDGDYYGRAVVEAARLCTAARGGQILSTEVVRLMVGSREDFSFKPIGQLELKGFPDEVPAFEVVWRPLPAAASAIPLPPRLRSVPQSGYVGRAAERMRIDELWQRARAGETQVLLISGESGIGKTRLAGDLAVRVHHDGATVLYGACEEELSAPYKPWIESLEHLVGHVSDEVLEDHARRAGGELARLVPALAARLPAAPEPRRSDPDTERYLLFAAIGDLLRSSSANAPTVVLLDDLHWADRETLMLLRHVAQEHGDARLLFIGTYRHSDLGVEHPLRPVLAELRRVEAVHRITLTGLDDTEVAALLANAAGHALDAEALRLAGELRRETDGNPFFTTEIMRHLVEQGAVGQGEDGRWSVRARIDELSLPQSVREVVGYRVQRLGPEAGEVLTAAAVIGREFDLDLLVGVTRRDAEEVLDLLERGVSASLLQESVAVPGRFAFAHALIEHTLYSELSRTRRARLHQRVATELESLTPDRLEPRLGELAHHWLAAAQPTAVQKALTYAQLAGERALASLAPDEAKRWYGRALELAEQVGDPDSSRRCELLIGLGQAQRQSGDSDFRQTLLSAAHLAQTHGDVDRLARAALSVSRGFFHSVGRYDEELAGVYEAALEALPVEDSRRVRVMSLLAVERANQKIPLERRHEMADEALRLARESDDPLLLAHALTYHPLTTIDASTLPERLRHTAEHVLLCERIGDPTLSFQAYSRRCMVLEAGDVGEFDRCLDRMAQLVERVPQPSLRWVLRFTQSARALLAGEIEQAEAKALEAQRVGIASGEPDAAAFFGAQIFGVRHEQARLGELTEALSEMRLANPNIPSFEAMVALTLCETGRREEAGVLLDRMTRERFASVDRGPIWISTLGRWCDVAVRCGDRAAAAELYGQLEPFADQFLWNLVGLWGAVAHHLGGLATLLGRFEAARHHLTAATQLHARMGAPIWLARTRLAQARLLLADHAPEREVAAAIEEVVGAARLHGSVVLEQQVRELPLGDGARVR